MREPLVSNRVNWENWIFDESPGQASSPSISLWRKASERYSGRPKERWQESCVPENSTISVPAGWRNLDHGKYRGFNCLPKLENDRVKFILPQQLVRFNTIVRCSELHNFELASNSHWKFYFNMPDGFRTFPKLKDAGLSNSVLLIFT